MVLLTLTDSIVAFPKGTHLQAIPLVNAPPIFPVSGITWLTLSQPKSPDVCQMENGTKHPLIKVPLSRLGKSA